MAKRKLLKIALVGTAPSSVHAPVKDESWKIWGVSARADHITRANRWFEIHRIQAEFPGDSLEEYRDCLRHNARDCPLYMFYPEPLVKEVVTYPVKQIADKYGTFFMTSSFAWMLALAIEEGADEIGLWGVDMEYGSEHRDQRAGVRHFCALAKHAGIKVTRLVSGGLSYEPVPYPLWQDDPLLQKIALRKEIFEKDRVTRTNIVTASKERIGQIDVLIPAIEDVVKGSGVMTRAKATVGKLTKERAAMLSQLPQFEHELAETKGVLANLDWTEDFLKP